MLKTVQDIVTTNAMTIRWTDNLIFLGLSQQGPNKIA